MALAGDRQQRGRLRRAKEPTPEPGSDALQEEGKPTVGLSLVLQLREAYSYCYPNFSKQFEHTASHTHCQAYCLKATEALRYKFAFEKIFIRWKILHFKQRPLYYREFVSGWMVVDGDIKGQRFSLRLICCQMLLRLSLSFICIRVRSSGCWRTPQLSY